MSAKIINFPARAPRPTLKPDGYVRLHELFPPGGWLLTATGEPMNDCDIQPGDLLYVDTKTPPRAADVCIFEQGGEFVVTRGLGGDGRLVGVVTHVIRDRRRGVAAQPA